MRRETLFLLGAGVLFISLRATAFPELIRHGYNQCSACHVSPNGGGILTLYGRSLAKEVLSTWGTEREVGPFFGVWTPPEWLGVGGDVRALQLYRNSPRVEEARFFVMQADVEAAVTVAKFQAVATLGRGNSASANPVEATLFSRRHYLLYRPTDAFSIRAGRFLTAFGINTAEHTLLTRRGLRWDDGAEDYSLEGGWYPDNGEILATAIFGRPDNESLQRDRGFAVRGALALSDTRKVGFGYYYGTSDVSTRHLMGPYALLGFTEHFSVLAELDFQNRSTPASPAAWGVVDYIRVNYEVYKGVQPYVSQELAVTDFGNSQTRIETYTLGVQWFPRPHLEFHLLYAKTRTQVPSPSTTDLASLLLHFYL